MAIDWNKPIRPAGWAQNPIEWEVAKVRNDGSAVVTYKTGYGEFAHVASKDTPWWENVPPEPRRLFVRLGKNERPSPARNINSTEQDAMQHLSKGDEVVEFVEVIKP